MQIEITKEQFCRLMLMMKGFAAKERELYEVGIDISEAGLDGVCAELEDFLVKSIFADEIKAIKGYYENNDISYFMWELDFGNKAADNPIKFNGNKYYLSSVSELWDYIQLWKGAQEEQTKDFPENEQSFAHAVNEGVNYEHI